MVDLLSLANYAITTKGTTNLYSLTDASLKFMGPANAFLKLLNCGSLRTLFDGIMNNMCTIQERTSEQMTGALLLMLRF